MVTFKSSGARCFSSGEFFITAFALSALLLVSLLIVIVLKYEMPVDLICTVAKHNTTFYVMVWKQTEKQHKKIHTKKKDCINNDRDNNESTPNWGRS